MLKWVFAAGSLMLMLSNPAVCKESKECWLDAGNIKGYRIKCNFDIKSAGTMPNFYSGKSESLHGSINGSVQDSELLILEDRRTIIGYDSKRIKNAVHIDSEEVADSDGVEKNDGSVLIDLDRSGVPSDDYTQFLRKQNLRPLDDQGFVKEGSFWSRRERGYKVLVHHSEQTVFVGVIVMEVPSVYTHYNLSLRSSIAAHTVKSSEDLSKELKDIHKNSMHMQVELDGVAEFVKMSAIINDGSFSTEIPFSLVLDPAAEPE